MSEKILYLMGAGASAQGLPLVNDSKDGKVKGMPTAMREMIAQIHEETLEDKYQEYLKSFAEKLEHLAIKSEEFSTVDTYAKYLFLTDRSQLEDLKITLSLYFTLEQYWNKKLDPRYLIWLVSIMQIRMFPREVKIITWNYDFQIELTARNFQKEEFGHIGVVTHMKPPLIGYYPVIGATFPSSSDNFEPNEDLELLHLNGIAGLYHHENGIYNHSPITDGTSESMEKLLSKFMNGEHDKHYLTFAWETSTESAQRMSKRIPFAKNFAENTTILVVIGYSFPFFNREIDREIFAALKSSGTLKKIYFQDPCNDGSFLKGQFDLGDIEINHVKEVDSFFIPKEL